MFGGKLGGRVGLNGELVGVMTFCVGFLVGSFVAIGANTTFVGFLVGSIVAVGANTFFVGFLVGRLVVVGATSIIVGFQVGCFVAVGANVFGVGCMVVGHFVFDDGSIIGFLEGEFAASSFLLCGFDRVALPTRGAWSTRKN